MKVWRRLRVVDSAMTGVSQEHPGLILIGSNFTGSKRTYMVDHETAHQWWFALVANDQYTAPWVDETLADFSAYLRAGTRPTSCSSRVIDGLPGSYGAFIGGCNAYYPTIYKRGTVMMYELADALAEKHELPKKQAKAVLEDLVAQLGKHLKKGAKIRVAGLVILQVRKRPARMGRNPATGEPIKIKASKKVRFRVAKDLKESI